MKRFLLLVLALVSLSLYSQEIDYIQKLDSIQNLINKNNEEIKRLQQHNELLTSEYKVVNQLYDNSNFIDNNSSDIYYTTYTVAFYSDIDLKNRLQNIPENAKVGLIEITGDLCKIIYNKTTGYSKKYSFISEAEFIKQSEQRKVKEEQLKRENEKAEFERPMELIKKYGTYYGKLIYEKNIVIGMTKDMVIESIGKPDDINRTVGSWGVHEQWVYERYDLNIYFENGKVSSFQD